MAQLAMPPIKAGSPQTVLTSDITQSDTQLYLADVTVFPDVGDTNNFVWIKSSSTVWEVCQYTAKVITSTPAGYLTIVRSGIYHFSSSGTQALAWSTGAKAGRNIGKPDFDILQNNIADHETRLQAVATTPATTLALGLVRIGSRLSITEAGILSADDQGIDDPILLALIYGGG